MNKNTAGAVLMLVLAAAGFIWAKPVAVGFVVLACIGASVTEELRDASPLTRRYGVLLAAASIVTALISWVAVVAALFALNR